MRSRDEEFLRLLRQAQGKLLRIAWAITGQEADAWDMVQEASLVAYDQFPTLRGGTASFDAWIRQILVNRCRNLLKARLRTVALESAAELQPDIAPGPEEWVDRAHLWDVVMTLEEHHRQVLTLRFLADMQIDDIATFLDLPAGTVKSRLSRALGALRRRFESTEKGPVKHA